MIVYLSIKLLSHPFYCQNTELSIMYANVQYSSLLNFPFYRPIVYGKRKDRFIFTANGPVDCVTKFSRPESSGLFTGTFC